MYTNWLWSQINPLLAIRRTGAWQIDFKDLTKYIWKPRQNKINIIRKKIRHIFITLSSSFSTIIVPIALLYQIKD